MTDKNELPKWVLASQDHLKKIIQKIIAIKKEAQDEIKRGLEKAQKADNLQQETEYLTRILSQNHDRQYWNDEIISCSGIWLANRIEALDSEVDGILDYAKTAGEIDENYHSMFLNAVSSTDSSSGSAIYLGAGIEKRFCAIEPAYKPVLSDFEPKRLTSREDLFKELMSILSTLGEKYVEMLKGSESALQSTGPDSQSQAAHSMRDCIQQSLEQLAPSKVVESQPWFEVTPGAPGGISRRSRFRYILYGSGENVDEKVIQQLDDLTEIAKDSLDLCQDRAHNHDPSLTHEEVLLTIDHARNALLYVLKQYINFRTR